MKIGIFGSGAVGCALASYLYDFCDDLYLCANINYLDKINKGIIVNDKFYNIKYTSNLKMDYLFITIKNYDLEKSLDDISNFVGKDTIIIPLLNGITAHDILSNYFKDNIVYYAMIRIEANKTLNGVNTSKITELAYGHEYNKTLSSDVLKIKEILDKASITNVVYEDMKRAVWRKFMLNVGINQISALTSSSYNDMRHPYLSDLLYKLFKEVVEIAKYEKVNITLDDADFMINDLKNRTSNRVTSLTEDIKAKRKSEVDYFGKVVLDLAKKHNIYTPYNEVIYKCLKAITDNYENDSN